MNVAGHPMLGDAVYLLVNKREVKEGNVPRLEMRGADHLMTVDTGEDLVLLLIENEMTDATARGTEIEAIEIDVLLPRGAARVLTPAPPNVLAALHLALPTTGPAAAEASAQRTALVVGTIVTAALEKVRRNVTSSDVL
jgi:hypothetical protein